MRRQFRLRESAGWQTDARFANRAPFRKMGVEMAVRFQILSGLVAMGNAGRHCGSHAQCLTSLYQARIAVLKKRYQKPKQRGPF